MKLKVLDRVYVTGRGYVTIVDNPDRIAIHVGDEIVDGGITIPIRGVEGFMIMLSPPVAGRQLGLVTTKETHGSEINIITREKQV